MVEECTPNDFESFYFAEICFMVQDIYGLSPCHVLWALEMNVCSALVGLSVLLTLIRTDDRWHLSSFADFLFIRLLKK